MQTADNKEKNKAVLSQAELYDVCAPAVYGKILSIVQNGSVADKILEHVFINAFKDKNTFTCTLQSPMITLLNKSRNKSYQTLKALTLFNECCEGASISITDKK